MSRIFDELILRVEAMEAELHQLIQANRDIILEKHEEAVRRIRRIVDTYWDGCGMNSIGAVNARLIRNILGALELFHPMHGEDWPGWPEGSA